MQMPAWVELDGAVNVRDLGRFALPDGGRTRSCVLLRSDAVHQLSERDVALLVGEWGLRHVIDLRAPGERAEQSRGRLGATSVMYSELAVLTDEMIEQRRLVREEGFAAGKDAAELIGDGYHQLLELGAGAFVTALERLAGEDEWATPALVHCTAGKDRTGVLVALLLEVAGVDRASIVADYAATDERIGKVRDRLAGMSAYTQHAAQVPAPLLAASGATMERFLDRLADEWGGAAAWFVANGASADALDRWRSRFTIPAA
ncbi:MAG: tyrosine-protein phosphatase [Acidimicrobiia bacterium]